MNDSKADLPDSRGAEDQVNHFCAIFRRLETEIQKAFVGHTSLVRDVLSILLSDGHVLLEGVPGLGKTLLVHTLAQAVDLRFSRIQFTPDLMPADVLGTMVLREVEGGGHELQFQEGPIMGNFILADEINRATPKTQSALLEAMQERQVTVARQTMPLPSPFIVLATQNPVEQDGTYPLPEAQLDRFMMKVLIGYPKEEQYHDILARTTRNQLPQIKPVSNGPEILEARQIARSVPVSRQIERYAIRLVMATQPGSAHAPEAVNQSVSLGASPRGVQALVLLGKVRALLDGRFAVSCQDIRDVAPGVLRHRIILGFEGQSRGVRPDDLIERIIESVSEYSD